MVKSKKALIYLIALAFVGLAVFFAAESSGGGGYEYVPYNTFVQLAEDGGVEGVSLTDGPRMTFSSGSVTYETDNPRNEGLKENLLLMGVAVEEAKRNADLTATVLSLAVFAGVVLLMVRLMGKQGTSMAMEIKEAVSHEACTTSFEDVAGNDEAKESVQDLVDFIKEPGKYTRYGARMPKGVIFYGPPGTGKTLMAKAVAGEAGVPFYAVSGSDFVQMYVGVGASRVRQLFKKARESGRAVIFIDEIDALAKKRQGVSAGGSDERDQTLNALLTEMSGFQPNAGIVVIAATNRLDTLDEALLRPGRFDRQVEIGLPNLRGRERILRLHSRNKPVSEQVDLGQLAKQTVFFSGAMLENLMNEAAITAARKGAEFITGDDVDEAYYTMVAGKAVADRGAGRENERRVTAFHEAGHALAARIKCPENTVAKITIIPSTRGAGGFCLNIPPDRMFFTKAEIEAQIVVCLAGRAAEEIINGFDNVTTGAANDLQQAQSLARDMIVKYGMSKSAGIAPAGDGETAREQAALLERLYGEAKGLLHENAAALKRVANALLLKESVNEAEFESLFTGDL